MHYSRIALAATPVLFTYVSAYGSAIIKNSCADDVYYWSCGDTPGEMKTVAGGSSHPETYYSKNGGGGISLKIGVKYPSGPKAGQIPGIWDLPAPNMTQFEYTVGTPGPPANAVFYDISNINGYPFMAGGVKMTSSDNKVNVACPKGVQYCQGAYNAPHDDHATGSAADYVDLTLELCSDAPGMTIGGSNAGSGGSSGGSSGGNDQKPSPEPSSSAPVAAPASSSPPSQPSTSDSSVAAPEKLAVNAPKQQADQQPKQEVKEAKADSPNAAEQPNVTVVQTITADPVVVTVHAKPKEKRHDHAHQHVHNKINKKRHGN
ncbi:hypothetical protein ACLMJK_002066 [Lecanora helva]